MGWGRGLRIVEVVHKRPRKVQCDAPGYGIRKFQQGYDARERRMRQHNVGRGGRCNSGAFLSVQMDPDVGLGGTVF